ncbi:hypothetical protein HHI36_022256 [Cryptolaemus montrouzieri]|uniref:Uncharacterized protein n=1 Tax=Cryptolaemus montrouzieri TaxID=559131 RepID=A0ABD2MZJ6_9CUCU
MDQGCQKTLTEIKKLKQKEETKNEKEEPAANRKRLSKTTPPEERRTELTDKVIKEISLFYSLAIQTNPDDKQAIKISFERAFIIEFQLMKTTASVLRQELVLISRLICITATAKPIIFEGSSSAPKKNCVYLLL